MLQVSRARHVVTDSYLQRGMEDITVRGFCSHIIGIGFAFHLNATCLHFDFNPYM